MIPPWKYFDVEVARLERLSPSFLRVTLTGPELNLFADNGFDQRIKMIVPSPDGEVKRTYTVRSVRPDSSEVDIDMVLHPGGDGPAIVWARAAKPGDKLALLGPDARYDGVHGGVDFQLSAPTVLIAGDETAVPAVMSILECLPPEITGEVILEVPTGADFLDFTAPPALKVEWTARLEGPHGSALVPAVVAAAARLVPPQARTDVPDIDVDRDILWEVPSEPAPDKQLYSWLAGEAGVIRTLRRHLVADRGLDRRSVAFMGYWRRGRTEN